MDSDGMCTVVACRDGSLRLLSSPLSKGFVQASTDESIPLRVARNVCRAPSLSLCPVAAIALVSRLALPPSLVRVHQLLMSSQLSARGHFVSFRAATPGQVCKAYVRGLWTATWSCVVVPSMSHRQQPLLL